MFPRFSTLLRKDVDHIIVTMLLLLFTFNRTQKLKNALQNYFLGVYMYVCIYCHSHTPTCNLWCPLLIHLCVLVFRHDIGDTMSISRRANVSRGNCVWVPQFFMTHSSSSGVDPSSLHRLLRRSMALGFRPGSVTSSRC